MPPSTLYIEGGEHTPSFGCAMQCKAVQCNTAQANIGSPPGLAPYHHRTGPVHQSCLHILLLESPCSFVRPSVTEKFRIMDA